MQHMPDVSIVIVSFNTVDLLDKCIASVYSSSPEIDREVIVIENASVDGSREMLAQKWPQVNVIQNDDNRGYAPACNQGLDIAQGRYVMALNSDAFLIDDALGKIINFMNETPDVCALVPKLLNEDGSLQYSCARMEPTVWNQFVYYSKLSRLFKKLAWSELSYLPEEDYKSICNVEVLSGAALVFRKTALDKVGLLDDRLIINYDDIEWCQRANRMGCRLVYYPNAEVVHLGCASRKFDVDAMHLANFKTTFVYFDITFGRVSSFFLKLTMLSSLLVALIKAAIQSTYCPSRREVFALRSRVFSNVIRMALGKD